MKKIENIIALFVCLVFGLTGAVLVNTESREPSTEHRVEIHFLATGQGDATLFEDGSTQVLIDTGPSESILGQLEKVMPITDRTIERVIITHPHADHLGGFASLSRVYQVGEVYFNGVEYESPQFEGFLSLIREKQIPTKRLVAGDQISEGRLNIKTIWPQKTAIQYDINDSSLVLLVEMDSATALMTGDTSASVLEDILNQLGPLDILKVPHHGSKTGLNPELVEILEPKYSVILVGKNSYGHPAQSTLNLLANSKVLRTDQLGTISFWVEKGGVFLY